MDGKHTLNINEELIFSYPEGFRVMDPAERQKLRMIEEGAGECISDPARHMLISIGYKQPPRLALMLLNAGDLAKKAEGEIRKQMQPYGYRLNSFSEKTIGGGKAYGFAYEYEAQGIGMFAESYVLKKGKTVYYFHCYMRKELQEESIGVWEEMTENISFAH